MPGNRHATENADYSCENAPPGGRRFPSKAKCKLLDEAQSLRGYIQCLLCGYWRTYELHHIRPWSEGGRSTAENGVLLCHNCHRLAHQGIITPQGLWDLKAGIEGPDEPIRDRRGIEEAISAAPPIEGQQDARCDETVRLCLSLLARLRRCDTKNNVLRLEIVRSQARIQLEIAGGLTSMLPADDLSSVESNRYMITMLASNVVQVGNNLEDSLLEIEGLHSLATNANAVHRLDKAIRHCDRILELLHKIEQREREYAAYTTRNLATIYAKVAQHQVAEDLIQRSNALRENDPETLVRHAEIMMLRGEIRSAERLMAKRMSLPAHAVSPIRQVIALRLCGLHRCLTGDVGGGLVELEATRVLAVDYNLGHQAGKIAAAVRWLSSSRSRQRISLLPTGKAWRNLHPSLLRLF
jgi:tetratricopeptide (TPR) repeat protein